LHFLRAVLSHSVQHALGAELVWLSLRLALNSLHFGSVVELGARMWVSGLESGKRASLLNKRWDQYRKV
jgi:hypothetical protein